MPRVALAISLLLACTPLESTDTGGDTTMTTMTTGAPSGEPQVIVSAKVDLIDLCGVEGAQAVTFLARKIGCEPGPPAPCTLRTDPYMEYGGDVMTCPSSQTSLDMEVEIPVTGRFQIEARTTTTSGSLSRCFGRGGQLPTVVTAEEIEARASIFVETTATACPDPG